MLKTCERQLRTWRNSLVKSFLYTSQLARRMGWGEGRPLVSQTLLTWHQCYLRHADNASVRDIVDAVSAAFQTPLKYKSDNSDSDHESLNLKGTVQWDCLLPIFSLMDSSQAPYSVFRDFSNLASSQWDIHDFFIDSPLSFISESRHSSYCLLRRIVTFCII
jgi:hypothetical protein